ncbi:MAG: hypothetical protein WB821_03440, partial [Burkholderiaceae bacterium]
MTTGLVANLAAGLGCVVLAATPVDLPFPATALMGALTWVDALAAGLALLTADVAGLVGCLITDLALALLTALTVFVGFDGAAFTAGLAFDFTGVAGALLVLAGGLATGFFVLVTDVLTTAFLTTVFLTTGLTAALGAGLAAAFFTGCGFALVLASVFFTGMDFFTGAFTSYLLTDPVAHP